MILLRLPLSLLLWSLFCCFLQIKWLPRSLLFLQMTSVLFTLKGQSYSGCLYSFQWNTLQESIRFCHQVERVQCRREDAAVRFLKWSPQSVKDAGHHQRCYQRFFDKARYFFLEFETPTWNDFVNLIFITVSLLISLHVFHCYFHVCLIMWLYLLNIT